jgi:hypothetical protein
MLFLVLITSHAATLREIFASQAALRTFINTILLGINRCSMLYFTKDSSLTVFTRNRELFLQFIMVNVSKNWWISVNFCPIFCKFRTFYRVYQFLHHLLILPKVNSELNIEAVKNYRCIFYQFSTRKLVKIIQLGSFILTTTVKQNWCP